MKVVWTPEALQDRSDIWDYIAADNPRAAVGMDKRFSKAVARLAMHPMLGRIDTIPGTRELIQHESYHIIYESDGEVVWTLALAHTVCQ